MKKMFQHVSCQNNYYDHLDINVADILTERKILYTTMFLLMIPIGYYVFNNSIRIFCF